MRALAEQADPTIKKRLLQLAAHYERRVDQPEKADRDGKRVNNPAVVSIRLVLARGYR
ncbi:hypothetical protein QMZ05_06620 [Bradyrhizobium sp. INPA03-11B]|uniref:hypothetical protein n=1 Tax=Bradyrhizobium sp. INPA03-11B TaxID=418598 RepID=UPI003390208C